MMGRSHLVTGWTAGAWTAGAVSVLGVPDELAVLVAPVVAYSALLPDLDHPRSTATYSLGPATILVSWILRLFVDHRGPTHTWQGALVFGATAGASSVALGAGWTSPLWGLAVAVGVLTHIWADARTLSGVPWRGRAWRGRLVRTGGGKLRVGRSFRTGSRREVWLLRRIYMPVACVSTVAALLLVAA